MDLDGFKNKNKQVSKKNLAKKIKISIFQVVLKKSEKNITGLINCGDLQHISGEDQGKGILGTEKPPIFL